MLGQDRVTASPGLQAGPDQRSAVAEIHSWGKRSVRSHPLQSLETVGGQTMLGVRTLQYFFVDLFTGRFQFAEFVWQAAFMAGTSDSVRHSRKTIEQTRPVMFWQSGFDAGKPE
jgi:hypothetical protein